MARRRGRGQTRAWTSPAVCASATAGDCGGRVSAFFPQGESCVRESRTAVCRYQHRLHRKMPKEPTIHAARPRAMRAARAGGDVRSGARPRVLRPPARASPRTPFGLAPPAAPFPSPPSSIAAGAPARGSPRRFASPWRQPKSLQEIIYIIDCKQTYYIESSICIDFGGKGTIRPSPWGVAGRSGTRRRRPTSMPPGRPARARAQGAQSPRARGGARRFRWMGSPDAGGKAANAGRCGRSPAGMRRIRAPRRGIDARAGPAAGGDAAPEASEPPAGPHLAWARGERGKAPGGGRARPVAGRRSRAPRNPWRTALREGEEARKWSARQLSGAARSPRVPSRGRGDGRRRIGASAPK